MFSDIFICGSLIYLLFVSTASSHQVWHDALGHVRLIRTVMMDREETRKKERDQKKRKDDDEVDISRFNTWVKYTLGVRHQVKRFYSSSRPIGMFYILFKIFIYNYERVLIVEILILNVIVSCSLELAWQLFVLPSKTSKLDLVL